MPKSNAELKSQAEELVGKEALARRFRIWITNLIKKELARAANVPLDEFFLKEAQIILNHLNLLSNSRYTLTEEHKRLIKARMDEGHTAEDFERVHTIKCRAWLNDPKMDAYLRPGTLYLPGNFEAYLSEWYRREAKQSIKNDELRIKNEGKAEDFNAKGAKDAEERKENERIVAEVMARKWWEFESFAEFVKWTAKLPTAEAVEAYPMPDRLRSNRVFKGVLVAALTGKGMNPAFEEEYQAIKNYELRIMNGGTVPVASVDSRSGPE